LSKFKHPLTDSAIVLAVTTAFLYAASMARYTGYLTEMKLDADVLSRDFHQILYEGFIAVWSLIFLLIFVVALALVIHRHLASKKRIRLESNTQLDRDVGRLLMGLVAASLLIVVLYGFHVNGNRLAYAVQKQLDVCAKKLPCPGLINVYLDGNKETLLFLACGARNCAGIDPLTNVAYYFPQNGHSFVYREKALTSAPAPAAASSP
jgi:hypothetical protein